MEQKGILELTQIDHCRFCLDFHLSAKVPGVWRVSSCCDDTPIKQLKQSGDEIKSSLDISLRAKPHFTTGMDWS